MTRMYSAWERCNKTTSPSFCFRRSEEKNSREKEKEKKKIRSLLQAEDLTERGSAHVGVMCAQCVRVATVGVSNIM